MAELEMQSPWVNYTNQIREMFKRDPEIKMTWNDDTLELHMYIDNAAKAEAIGQILPASKSFGKNDVKIVIHPSNDDGFSVGASTIHDAFAGNPIYHFTRVFSESFLSNPVTYVVFAKEVIQYWNDDLNDLYGNTNRLAEDIARDIFENVSGVFFCTDIE